MHTFCFNKKCSYFQKEAPWSHGIVLTTGYHPTHCKECGKLLVELDNYGDVDYRTEDEKFTGTIKEYREMKNNYGETPMK